MRVLQVKSYDLTYAVHKKLEQEGKLSGTIDEAYLERMREAVRYWDGRKWQRTISKVEVQSPAAAP